MAKISLFKNISKVYEPENIDFLQYLEDTRDGKYEDIVTECRLIKDKEERDAFKRTMPTATLSGTFTQRRDDALVEHSTYLNMDLDDVDDINSIRKLLHKEKSVYSCFVSTGGKGIRVVFKIRPDKHRESFAAISAHLFDTYGLISDPNGVNESKPYVVSWDPYLYLNHDETAVWTKYIKEVTIKPLQDFVHTSSDFDAILGQISGRNIDIAPNYNEWLKIGFALAEQFGEGGRDYFHEISRHNSKYNHKRCELQYTACLKGKGSKTARISTFYYLAKIAGISITSEQTKIIVRTTKNGLRSGLKKEQIIENLKKFQNITGADEVVGKIFDNPDKGTEEEESILPLLEMFINNNYSLQLNEVTGYFEQGDKSLSSSDLNTVFVAAKKVIPKLDYPLMMRLLKSDFIPAYNPFFKFFGSDGIPVVLPAIPIKDDNKTYHSPLIDKLAKTIENDDPIYTHFFLRKWMVSVISAMHKVHSPLWLQLLGGQNSGKTEFFRRLLPLYLQRYYAESKLDKEKDDELLMCENILVMDDELGGKSRQDNLKMNNITSKQWFSLRRPYGDHNEKILRLAVLCGTSNYLNVFSDPTGNRRVIPIHVLDINKEMYNFIDKDELWREAFRLYKEGFDWRVTHFDIPYLNKDKEKYESVVAEKELICKYFTPGNSITMYSTEVKVELEILTKQRLNINSIGRELERLGFMRKTVREDGGTPKKWHLTRINRITQNNNNEPNPF